MTENDQPDAAVDLAELGRHFAEISGRLADQGELQPERVISFAADVVPHASHCGITLLRQGRQPELVAASDAVAEAVDLLQYATGEGPCLDAADDNDAVRTPDVGADPRWPVFGPACVRQTGVRSVLSLRMPTAPGDRAALNFYANVPDAFDDMDLGVASIVAPFAAIAVTTALHGRDVANLGSALGTSRQIGTAIGILMSSHRATSDQAFSMLRVASQHLNRKLHDVAEEVALTGELPAPNTSRSRPSAPASPGTPVDRGPLP